MLEKIPTPYSPGAADAADRILKEAASLPFLTTASVVALLDLVMMQSARDYIASTAGGAA